MPQIEEFRCDSCDLAFPLGCGGYMYAVADDGRRVPCPHPSEFEWAEKVTGLGIFKAYEAGRIGHASHCLCFECFKPFDIDLDRDVKRCPECGSLNVRSARGSVGCLCPKCKTGHIREKPTGMIA